MKNFFKKKKKKKKMKEILNKLNIEQLEYLMIEQLKTNLDLKVTLAKLEGGE